MPLKTKITKARMLEMLSELSPSCGVMEATRKPDDRTVVCFVEMTVAEWKELSPETVEQYGFLP